MQYKEHDTYKLNVAELLGLKKCNTNQLLFNFLMYEICKYEDLHVKS